MPPIGNNQERFYRAPFLYDVRTIAASTYLVFDCRNCTYLTIICPSGVTATAVRVDSESATADTSGAENSTSCPAATLTKIQVDWPYYKVNASSGTVRAWVG